MCFECLFGKKESATNLSDTFVDENNRNGVESNQNIRNEYVPPRGENVAMTGWLNYKTLGGIIPGNMYHRAFFVLHDGSLYMYSSPQPDSLSDEGLKEIFQLVGAIFKICEVDGHRFCINIKNMIVLDATNRDNQRAWYE